jgi:hypothetical protein
MADDETYFGAPIADLTWRELTVILAALSLTHSDTKEGIAEIKALDAKIRAMREEAPHG